MIDWIKYKGLDGIQLENNVLRIVILPELGGKIASFYRKDKDFELLFQHKEERYRLPTLYDPFSSFDASGFDDAFPTIDAGMVKLNGKKVDYPDHGELWSSHMQTKLIGEKAEFFYASEILPYHYKKTAALRGDSLSLEYEITNTGAMDLPCIWAMHCLVRCEEDMELMFPPDTREVINVLDSKVLGEVGRVHPYPVTTDLQDNEYALNRISKRETMKMEKYYVRGKVKQGTCGVNYPSQHVRFDIHFDPEQLPYLGFWVTEGGFRGDYNCALEPTNGYYDSIETASRLNGLYSLKSGEKLVFTIKLQLQ